jgi:hypothetical protein
MPSPLAECDTIATQGFDLLRHLAAAAQSSGKPCNLQAPIPPGVRVSKVWSKPSCSYPLAFAEEGMRTEFMPPLQNATGALARFAVCESTRERKRVQILTNATKDLVNAESNSRLNFRFSAIMEQVLACTRKNGASNRFRIACEALQSARARALPPANGVNCLGSEYHT